MLSSCQISRFPFHKNKNVFVVQKPMLEIIHTSISQRKTFVSIVWNYYSSVDILLFKFIVEKGDIDLFVFIFIQSFWYAANRLWFFIFSWYTFLLVCQSYFIETSLCRHCISFIYKESLTKDITQINVILMFQLERLDA